jgi:hypothetical protein
MPRGAPSARACQCRPNWCHPLFWNVLLVHTLGELPSSTHRYSLRNSRDNYINRSTGLGLSSACTHPRDVHYCKLRS